MQKLPSVFVCSGLVFLFSSVIIGWLVGPLIIDDQISQWMRLQNGSYQWNKWTNPTAEMFLKVYFFNVTNPEEVEEGGIPIFQELGPYTYQEKRIKQNIFYNEENDTLRYQEPIWFHFREDLSSGKEEDIVTSINIPLVGVSHRLSSFSSWIRYLLGTFLVQYGETLFVERTVKELVFDGYFNPMVEELQGLTGELFFKDAMVGLLVGRNGTTDDTVEVYAGNKDSSKFGGIVKWNRKPYQTAWKDEPCNAIEGASEGTVFPPFLTKSSILTGYHRDVCRTFEVKYVNDITYDGIDGYRFEPDEDQYKSGKNNPKNTCFCYDHSVDADLEECYEDGIIPGSACHKGAPVSISNPHFLYAPHYLNMTRGLSPNKEAHGLFAEIEPRSGLLLRATRRMQMNLDLKPNGALKGMRHVPTMQFPLVWVEESGFIDKDMMHILEYRLIFFMNLIKGGRWVGVGASLAMIISALSINFMRARKKPYIYN